VFLVFNGFRKGRQPEGEAELNVSDGGEEIGTEETEGKRLSQFQDGGIGINRIAGNDQSGGL